MRFSTAAVITGLSAVAVQGAYAPPPAEYETSAAPVYSTEAPTTAAPAKHSSTPDSYVTEVVTAYTTYCPEATEITHGGVTYSVTSATTLTLPVATVTKPVYTTIAPPPVYTTLVKPTRAASAVSSAPYKASNGTAKATGTGAASPTSYSSPTPIAAKGDAAKLSFGFAGLIAAFGLVAAL